LESNSLATDSEFFKISLKFFFLLDKNNEPTKTILRMMENFQSVGKRKSSNSKLNFSSFFMNLPRPSKKRKREIELQEEEPETKLQKMETEE
jgi:hypothetical protein